jgi:hypothetical protein
MATNLSPVAAEALAGIVPQVAGQLHRTYRRLPEDDIAQAMWVRIMERASWFSSQVEAGKTGLAREELRRAGWKACKSDERYERAQKAAAAGYDIEDEQYYSLGLLRALLPAYVDGGIAEEPPRQRGGKGSSLKSERGDYLAMLCDVSSGMDAVAPHERRTLTEWFALPQGDDSGSRSARSQWSSSHGMTVNAMEQRVTRALRALQKALGGPNPWRRKDIEYATGMGGGKTPSGFPSRSQGARLALAA